jgi:hypothetical protein
MRNMMTAFYPHLALTLDTDPAGGPINWDVLAKGVVSMELISPILGNVFPHFHTRGPTLMHLISVIALRYEYPQGARSQIPLNVDADYTVDLFYVLPIAQECLADPMESAQWTGFYDGGTVEIITAANTIYEDVYPGAVTKAPVTLRCLAEAIPVSREYIGVPNQWRRRQIAGGGSSPVLKNVGGETSMNGIAPGCGLAGLFWLTDATGIGLGGPDGVDALTSIALQWRGLKQNQNLDGFFHYVRKAQEKRTSPISGTGVSPPEDGANWPSTMGATAAQANGRPSQNSQQMFLPIIAPGRDLETAKLQRVLGDLQIDFNTSPAITAPHEFMSWEFLEFSEAQANALATLGLFRGSATRKNINGRPGKPSNFRYTAIEFI